MPAKALMIQGTGSHVGKSVLAAACCRIFTQDGLRVLPFKAQNMSNNAFVTPGGGEISRAQAEQAAACQVEPSALMNPILLKPTTDIGAQVILLGTPIGTMTAQAYEAEKPRLADAVRTALRTLMDRADLLVIEGAGSPAEINLKAGDLVNMWVAKQAQAAVLLVGDIDRGGVFAHLVGTLELLEADERRLVRGCLINKFRGDFALLEPGIRWLEARAGLPVIGTIPYFHDLALPEEDAIPQERPMGRSGPDPVRIDVVRLPRISNFTDFDALGREPDVRLRYCDRPQDEGLPDCLILPGSKSTMADLGFVRERGFDRRIRRCLEAGREVLGICGGFQMLGLAIRDPQRLEAAAASADGLGLLPAVTVFHRDKVTTQARGVHVDSGLPVEGFEIHMGRMQVEADCRPVLRLAAQDAPAGGRDDGAQSPDGRVWGTHLHGLFDADEFRRWWLNRLRRRRGLAALPVGTSPSVDDRYDRLADAVRHHLDMIRLYELLGLTAPVGP